MEASHLSKRRSTGASSLVDVRPVFRILGDALLDSRENADTPAHLLRIVQVLLCWTHSTSVALSRNSWRWHGTPLGPSPRGYYGSTRRLKSGKKYRVRREYETCLRREARF